jgi:hypothetical protein
MNGGTGQQQERNRDNVATPNLTIIPFPRAKRRLAVTRVTGIRAVLRHAAHGHRE